MFDPARDTAISTRSWWLGVLLRSLLVVGVCAALLPSVTRFTVGEDAKGCTPIVDGWHADRGPTAADRAINSAFLGPNPTQQQQLALARSNARFDWLNGPGACVPGSRHRLILSGLGLGFVALLAGGVAMVRVSIRKAKAASRRSLERSALQTDTAQPAHA